MEDRLVDVIAFFQKVTQQAGADVNKLNEFTEFFTHSMIHRLQHNNKKKLLKQNQNLSGLGMFLPKSRQEIAKYRYLPIFSNLRLVELFDAILLN